ncbi:MAG: hypothetical protein ACYSUM_01555 [Planctomycetota bacterium]
MPLVVRQDLVRRRAVVEPVEDVEVHDPLDAVGDRIEGVADARLGRPGAAAHAPELLLVLPHVLEHLAHVRGLVCPLLGAAHRVAQRLLAALDRLAQVVLRDDLDAVGRAGPLFLPGGVGRLEVERDAIALADGLVVVAAQPRDVDDDQAVHTGGRLLRRRQRADRVVARLPGRDRALLAVIDLVVQLRRLDAVVVPRVEGDQHDAGREALGAGAGSAHAHVRRLVARHLEEKRVDAGIVLLAVAADQPDGVADVFQRDQVRAVGVGGLPLQRPRLLRAQRDRRALERHVRLDAQVHARALGEPLPAALERLRQAFQVRRVLRIHLHAEDGGRGQRLDGVGELPVIVPAADAEVVRRQHAQREREERRVLRRRRQLDAIRAVGLRALLPEGEPDPIRDRALRADAQRRLTPQRHATRLAGLHVHDLERRTARPLDIGTQEQRALGEDGHEIGVRGGRGPDHEQQRRRADRPGRRDVAARDVLEADRAGQPHRLLDDGAHQLRRVLVVGVVGGMTEGEARLEAVLEFRVHRLDASRQPVVGQRRGKRHQEPADQHEGRAGQERHQEEQAHEERQPQEVVGEEEDDERRGEEERGARHTEEQEQRPDAPAQAGEAVAEGAGQLEEAQRFASTRTGPAG